VANLLRSCGPSALVASVVIASLPGFALAQEVSTPSTKEVSIDQRLIEEIIVTATRREADLQSVPLSVYVVTDEALARLGAMNFADYAGTVPGLTFTDSGAGGENQTIRGISTNIWFNENSTTALYLDEVSITNAGGVGGPYNPDPMLVDINRIEVLRGPQGTLFGATAMGGAIRIITNEPNLSKTEGFVDAAISSTKHGSTGYELHGMFNMPLNDGRAGVRAVAYHRAGGGYVDNLGNGQKDVNDNEISGARLTGKLLLSDRATLTGRFVYQDRKSDGTDMEEPDDGPRNQSRLTEPNEDEWAIIDLGLNVDLDWGSLVTSTSFLDRTIDTQADLSGLLDLFFGVSNPLRVVNNENIDEFVQEIRVLSSGENRLNWLAGVFYQHQDQEFNQDFPSPGFDALTGGLASMFGSPDNLFVVRSRSRLEQLALYGELSSQLTDRVEVTAGARWFDIDRDFRANNVGLMWSGGPSESGSAGESGVTPKFSVNFAANDNLTLYGTAAEGFRPGGINPPEVFSTPGCVAELQALGFTEFPVSYDSDSLWSYEIGAKSRLYDGRMNLNVAAYHINWSDMQTSKFLNCGAGFIENVGDAKSDGVEFELVSHPSDSIDIILAASYNEAELDKDVPNLGGVAGDRIPGVPRFTANAGISHFFTLFGDQDAFIHADYQYVGSSFNEFGQAVRQELPSYDLVNFRVGVHTQHWSTAVFLNNVFDERGLLFARSDILGDWVTGTRPRVVGISTTWTF